MKNCKWYSIPKFPTYEINGKLEVRHRKFHKIKSPFMSDGYWRINIAFSGRKHRPYLHQIVAWTFVPNPDNKPEIHHIDGDPLNNLPPNLMWVTKKEHRLLSMALGQVPRKISDAEVVDIRNDYSKEKEVILAKKYGVHKNTIRAIATGRDRIFIQEGKIHPLMNKTKEVINIKTGKRYSSSGELALLLGIKQKGLKRKLNGERYNNTPYRYLGEEHKAKVKPKKIKVIPFVPYSFGVIIPKRQLAKSKNPFALWKKVIQCDMQGKEIAIHASIREATRVMGSKDHKLLQKLLNGRKGKTYKGFKWKYA